MKERSCEELDICSTVLAEDSVVCFWKVQMLVNNKEVSTIGVYLVSDGIDFCCCVGFLQQAQITEVSWKHSESSWKRKQFNHNKGCCIAAIIAH
jgi:hypothetical protein